MLRKIAAQSAGDCEHDDFDPVDGDDGSFMPRSKCSEWARSKRVTSRALQTSLRPQNGTLCFGTTSFFLSSLSLHSTSVTLR